MQDFEQNKPWYQRGLERIPALPYRTEIYCDKEAGLLPVCCSGRPTTAGVAQDCIFCKSSILILPLHHIRLRTFVANFLLMLVDAWLCWYKKYQFCCKGINPVSTHMKIPRFGADLLWLTCNSGGQCIWL